MPWRQACWERKSTNSICDGGIEEIRGLQLDGSPGDHRRADRPRPRGLAP